MYRIVFQCDTNYFHRHLPQKLNFLKKFLYYSSVVTWAFWNLPLILSYRSTATPIAITIEAAVFAVLSVFENLLICFLFFVVNTVLFFSISCVVWRCFFYIVDYYIYKGFKELETEEKKHNIRPFRVHYVDKKVR